LQNISVIVHRVNQHTGTIQICLLFMAMGNKRMCESANVATGKRQIKSVDAKCGCVGGWMCG